MYLVKRPTGDGVGAGDLECRDRPIPTEVEAGMCLVKNILVSLDPTHRIWMSDTPQYMPSVGLNTVMRAGTIGKVVLTSDPEKMPLGTVVSGLGGVQEYSIEAIAGLNPVVPGVPLSWNMSVLSMVIGHTAWVGTKICGPKPGETFVVSGGAGAVGSVAGQLAKIAGARVVGIAGTPAKCAWMTEELGFDGAINYKTETITEGLKREAPDGVDCYFDNVGGDVLDQVLGQFNTFGRVAFCGAISTYGKLENKVSGPSNWKMLLMRRITLQGFICVDHVASIMESMTEIGAALQDGKIKFNEDCRETGVENYVDTVNLLYTGGNKGKLMMKIADE